MFNLTSQSTAIPTRMHHMHAMHPWRSKKGVRSPGPGVTCSCEQPGVDTGNKVWILCNSGPCSHPWIHLSGPQGFYYVAQLGLTTLDLASASRIPGLRECITMPGIPIPFHVGVRPQAPPADG